MAISVDEDVLRLKVSMSNVVGMNVLDGKKLSEGIRGGQIIELIDSQAPPYKIVHLSHQMSAHFEGLEDHPQGCSPISIISEEKQDTGYMRAYRDEVVVLGVVEACMKRENKTIPIQLFESSLLIENRAACDFSPFEGVFVGGFESIQVRRMFLSHEINLRIGSRTQGAQELVIVEARGAGGGVSIDNANGSLEGERVYQRANFKPD